MDSLLNLLCQIQMLELDNPSIVLPQYQLSAPIRLPPTSPIVDDLKWRNADLFFFFSLHENDSIFYSMDIRKQC